ncbi:hypothetical protein ACEPAH_5372 [Sanghuangporus vaninii]
MDYTYVEIEEILHQYLGPLESVKSVLVVHAISSGEHEVTSTLVGDAVIHILAVVSSADTIEEEGSVFIFRPVSVSHQPESDVLTNYQLRATLPLTNDLAISMAQSRSRSGTIDLRLGRNVPTVKPLFTLTLSYGNRKWSFSTDSSENLRIFVTECRRLINVASSSSRVDFRWLNKYQSHRQLQVPTLFPRPDLRKIRKPSHLDLSASVAGQPGDEDADLLLIIDDWLRSQVEKDKDVFIQEHPIRIRLGTFNVNGKTPSQDLAPWVRPQHSKQAEKLFLPPLKDISPISLSSFTASDYLSAQSSTSRDELPLCDPEGEPDIYVLGFQELDLSTEALLISYNTIREDMWVEAIFAALGEVRGEYTKLISKQLVGMLVICIVRNELVKDITDIRTSAIGTGLMGVMGNKGAVALRFTVHSTVVTFVNAHLAAFDEYTDRRNADFHDLSRRLVFVSPAGTPTSEETMDQSAESIFQSDVLFWMVPIPLSFLPSDLNYRIDLPDAEVRQLIAGDLRTRKYDIRDLLSQDQLTKARLQGKAFEDFIEGEISDLPSYRFSTGVATDANGYDMKRRPAWTDRVLYQISPRIRHRQAKYTVHPELTMSDHKPVSAEFCIATRRADEPGYYSEVRRMVEHVEELIVDTDSTPKLKVLSSEVQFGDVWYKRKAAHPVTLRNIGKVACAFRFVSSGENESTFAQWLSAEPRMGIVLPDEELSILLTICVDETSAPGLNTGEAELQHTLILHTLRGKDHFLVVSGNYKRTCFANDLATLVRLPGSIRQSSTPNKSPERAKSRTNAPREVMRLINWLMTNATDISDLFVSHGNPQMEDSIRESLDTGEEFDFDASQLSEDDRHVLALSFAGTLLRFFQSLPSSVIPASLQERCALITDRDEAFEVLSSELPNYVLNVWISLTAFLHYVAQQRTSVDQEKPNENIKAVVLACIFAPVLLRDEPGIPVKMTPLAKRRFLLHFIQ